MIKHGGPDEEREIATSSGSANQEAYAYGPIITYWLT